jgi:L-2-hydroxyglutarate oxidase
VFDSDMEQRPEVDFLIIGSGIVGLSVGIALLEANPSLKVDIFEKETEFGEHASGRNSGVLHAGFYYSPDSLKARFCADGNRELKKICLGNNLPLRETGKVVVTSNYEEVPRLESLFKRGLANDIDIEIHDANKLSKFEPTAKTIESFLWSPTTAVANPKSILEFLVDKFKSLGGTISIGQEIRLIDKNNEISAISKDKILPTKYIVNSAGVHADSLAKSVGVGEEFMCLPFMGVYRVAKNESFRPKTLVYPVPHPLNPFLGAHLTLTVDGKLKIGPTAIPLVGREQYSINYKITIKEVKDSLKAVNSLIQGREYNFPGILRQEFPKISTKFLIKDVKKIVPGISQIRNWEKIRPGIRAQLVNVNNGKMEQDFIVRNHRNSTHILNAVSPGWTSALPFGRWIALEILAGI